MAVLRVSGAVRGVGFESGVSGEYGVYEFALGVLEGVLDQNTVDCGTGLHVFGVDHMAPRFAGGCHDY